jgi:hypothetical protein
VKRCPFCAEEILSAARKCKHCGEFIDGTSPASQEERILFWRSSGMERTFFPSRYRALCVTNQRIILVDLGSALWWFLCFGLLGVWFGRNGARTRGQALASLSPREILAQSPGSIVLDRSDVGGLELVHSAFSGDRIKIRSRKQGTREYTFDDLKPQHANEVAEAYRTFKSGTGTLSPEDAAFVQSHGTFPRFFWWATLLPIFYPVAPLALWLAFKSYKDAVQKKRGQGLAVFAIVWSSLWILMLVMVVVMLILMPHPRGR